MELTGAPVSLDPPPLPDAGLHGLAMFLLPWVGGFAWDAAAWTTWVSGVLVTALGVAGGSRQRLEATGALNDASICTVPTGRLPMPTEWRAGVVSSEWHGVSRVAGRRPDGTG